tara:strand:+ start:522 stop:1505 length:984 start_codon:yes stop_codon:yes gene_type:complete
MASAATPNRIGQVNAANADDALFLKVFSGETITAFEEANVMLSRTMKRTIKSGKSAQFPVFGKTTASYHVPGAELAGATLPQQNEKVITIDDLLVSHVFIDKLDEARSHYDVRSTYSTEMGRALAKRMDQNLLKLVHIGANTGATISSEGSGAGTALAITDANYADGDKKVARIFDAAQKFDELDIPKEDRYIVLNPEDFYDVIDSTKAINRDYGAQGDIANANMPRLAGFTVLVSNHMPSTTVNAAVTGENNTYYGNNTANNAGNFVTTRLMAFHKSAVGTVSLQNLQTESEYDIRRQGTLLVAKMAVGHGVLRPECCWLGYDNGN